jgi:hypothetical protein
MQKAHIEKIHANRKQKIPTRKSFDTLSKLPNKEEVENPHKNIEPGKGTGKDKKNLDPFLKHISSQNPQAYTMLGKIPNHDGGDIIMQIDEKELEDIDLDKIEDSFNWKELQSIKLEQLRKVHKFFIESTSRATSCLGVHL